MNFPMATPNWQWRRRRAIGLHLLFAVSTVSDYANTSVEAFSTVAPELRLSRVIRAPSDQGPLCTSKILPSVFAPSTKHVVYSTNRRRLMTRLQAAKQRPDWAHPWMPIWLVTMSPRMQLAVAVLLYIFHLQVLSQRSLSFPFQLLPNNEGLFQSIGLDSLAGIFTLIGYYCLRRSKKSPVSSLLSTPRRRKTPWKFPKPKPNTIGPGSTGIFGMILLIQAYFFTGRFALFWEDFFYAAAGMGFPLTIAMHRSLCVLMGHMTWVAIGALILKIIPRPQPFFGGGYEIVDDDSENIASPDDERVVKRPLKYKWFTSTWKTNWLWWSIGGYFVSSWFFNIADFINQVVLPEEILEATAEGVVAQLINPEHNDLAASIVGCIAPCISAPWWEEILYRGFMLPAMCLHMPFWISLLMSGVVFSAHHISATGAIPLAVLGWTWAAIYAKSGNLLVTILIHAMWNSRVFLGSWLGL